MNIYVGNLAYGVADADLSQAFSAYGAVSNATVIKDKFSGQSKGFGFVEMPNNSEANEAIKNLNEKPLKGRNMRVNEARPREDRPARPPRRTGGYQQH
jgi:RNA recognition motif-containing protein